MLFGLGHEGGDTRYGVMVGEGDGGEVERFGLGDDLGGGEGAVGVGRVEVEVNGHGGSFLGEIRIQIWVYRFAINPNLK